MSPEKPYRYPIPYPYQSCQVPASVGKFAFVMVTGPYLYTRAPERFVVTPQSDGV